MPGMRNWFRDGWLVEKSQLCLRDTNARGNRETRVPDTYESRPLRASLEPVHKFSSNSMISRILWRKMDCKERFTLPRGGPFRARAGAIDVSFPRDSAGSREPRT